MPPEEIEEAPLKVGGESLVVRNGNQPPPTSLNQRMQNAFAKIREASAAGVDVHSLPATGSEGAQEVEGAEESDLQVRPARASNGQFKRGLRRSAASVAADPTAPAAAEETESEEEIPTRPDAPAPKAAGKTRLDRLEERAKQERARRGADMTLREVQQLQQQLAADRRALQQQQLAHEQQMAALRSGDPGVLRALLAQVGPDNVAQFLVEEANPEMRARRAAQQAQNQPPAPAQPTHDPRVDELWKLVQATVIPQRQAAVEQQFQSMIRGAGDVPFGEGGTPLTAKLLEKSPKKVMLMATAAFNRLKAEGKPFDDQDVALTIEEDLQEFSALGGSVTPQAPHVKAPPVSPVRPTTSVRIPRGEVAPIDTSLGRLIPRKKSSNDSLDERAKAAMRRLAQLNRR